MNLFKKNDKQNKKGFTLIELLTTMVIIAILSVVAIGGVTRYVNRSREQKVVQTKKNIALAAELYVQANRDMLPKEIGESTIIRVSELKNNNYFKEKIVDEEGNDCIQNSYVRVFKYAEDEYSYETVLYCGDEEPNFDTGTSTKPYLKTLKDEKENDTKILYTKSKDVKKAYFSFVLLGDESNSGDSGVGIYSYSYSILVKTGTDSEPIEVFNSGNIDAQKATKVEVKSKPLSLYFDFTGETYVYVKVRAINVYGGTLDYVQQLDTETGDSNGQKFNDVELPVCQSIENGAQNDSDWINKSTAKGTYYAPDGDYNISNRHYPAQIQVVCNDRFGSGCQREMFTKSWPNNEMSVTGKVNYKYGARWGFVEIQDNAVNSKTENGEPNKRKCYVRVNVDVQAPTVTLNIYKTDNNKQRSLVLTKTLKDTITDDGKVSSNPLELVIKDDEFDNLVGNGDDGLKWMNKQNYPYGIEIEASIEDNLYLYGYSWRTNDPILERGETDLTKGIGSLFQSKATLYPETASGYVNAKLDLTQAGGSMQVTDEKTNGWKNTAPLGYFSNAADYDVSKDNASEDPNVLNQQFENFKTYEKGILTAQLKGMRLFVEGRRVGYLDIFDKAGNITEIKIYANIDRTPPPKPVLIYKKIGVRNTTFNENTCEINSTDEYILNPTTPLPNYTPADDSNYALEQSDKYNCGAGRCFWSKEQIRISLDKQVQEDTRHDSYGTKGNDPFTGTYPSVPRELSGWWKYIIKIYYQDPSKPKYQWGCTQEFDSSKNALDEFDILPEGVHKVFSDSCDNAGNCYSDPLFENSDINQYVKIDYTKPICPLGMEFKLATTKSKGFHDHLDNPTSDKVDDHGNITFELPSGVTNPKEVGWLRDGESVKLYHLCHDSTTKGYKDLWTTKTQFISPTQSSCDVNSAYNKQSFLYDSDIETTKAGANGYYDEVHERYVYANEELDKTIGGHVYDIAGNMSDECPTREVKIDTLIPTCRTLIAYPTGDPPKSYPVNGDVLGGSTNCPTSKFNIPIYIEEYKEKINFSETSCDGWLGLQDGGNGYPLSSATSDKKGNRVTKKVAIVAQDCDDPKSTATSMMADVVSTCSNDTMYKIYDFEVQTKIAGAMGIGVGGYVYDNAGNTRTCDADKTLNIDYTAPSCTTTITYPKGNPINGTSSIESGWLGYTDNNSGTVSSSCNEGSGDPTGSSLSSVERQTYNLPAYVSRGTNFNSALSRGEFARMIITALGIDVSSISTANVNRVYTDLTASTPNVKYIIAAADRGYFIGYDDRTFKPSQTITRSEITTAMMRMAETLAMPDNCDGTDIPDIGEIANADMQAAFRAAANKCVVIGYEDGTFRPNAQATIGEGVLVLYRVLRDEANLGYECKANTNYSSGVTSNWLKTAADNAVNSYTCTLASTEVSRPGSDNDPAGNQASDCDTTGNFNGANTTRDKITHYAYIQSGGYYDYDSTLTRAEYVKIMLDAAGIAPNSSYSYSFPDVNRNTQYHGYISKAKALGYIIGDENGNFRPTESLTRAELVTGVLRIYRDKGYDTGKRCNDNPPDVQAGKWYTDDMKEAAKYCILIGDDRGMYMPEEYATKSEVVAVLNRSFRKHDGMYCKYATTNVFTNIQTTHWAYEDLYEASNTHTCSQGNADGDGDLQGDVGETFDDTTFTDAAAGNICNDESCKKTAVISQKCDDMGTYNVSIGQNNIRSGCDTRKEKGKELKSKTYNQQMDHKQAGAVSVGDNGVVFDYAENWTDCNYNTKNFHWVRIDYDRPVCLVLKSYYQIVRNVDTNTGNVTSTTKSLTATRNNVSQQYYGWWMGEGSYATLQSSCTEREDPKHSVGVSGTTGYKPGSNTNSVTYTASWGSQTYTYANPAYGSYSVRDLPNQPIQSGCWSSKTAKTTYSHELKTDAATPKGFDIDVYVYDLAGNRSQNACERSIVQIDTTAPICDVVGVHDYVDQTSPSDTANEQKLYFANADAKYEGKAVGASKVTVGLHHLDKWQPDGWLNAQYEVRVVSECNEDEDIKESNIKKCSGNGNGACATYEGFSIDDPKGTGCLCSGDNPAAPCRKGYYDTVTPTNNKHQQQRSAVYKALTNRVFDRMVGSMNEAHKTESEGFINTPSQGYNANSYTGTPITRGEYAMMIVAALGSSIDCSTVNSGIDYLDAGTADSTNSGYINTDLSMEQAISCATGLGFFEGRDDGCFDPNAGITRAEMIVAGIRMARIEGFAYDQVTPSETLENDLKAYEDKWYYNDIVFAIYNGLIEGEEDLLLHGDDIATRAEAVTYLVRATQKECDSSTGGATGSYFTTGSWADGYLNEAASSYACDGIEGNAATVYDHVGNMMTCEKIEVKLDDERPTCKNYILTEKNQEPVSGGSGYHWTGGQRFGNQELVAISECNDGVGSQCDERKDKSYPVVDKISGVRVEGAEWKLTDKSLKKSNSNKIKYPWAGVDAVITYESLGSYKAASPDIKTGTNAQNGWVKDAVDNIRSCDTVNPEKDVFKNELVKTKYGIDYIKPYCKHIDQGGYDIQRLNISPNQQWFQGTGSIQGNCLDDDLSTPVQSGCRSKSGENNPKKRDFGGTLNTNNWNEYWYKEVVKDIVDNQRECIAEKAIIVRIDNQKPVFTNTSCSFSGSYSTDWSNSGTTSGSGSVNDGEGSSSAAHGNNQITLTYYVGGISSSRLVSDNGGVGSFTTELMKCSNTYTGRIVAKDQVGNSASISCSGSLTTPGCCTSKTEVGNCPVSCSCPSCGTSDSDSCRDYWQSNYNHQDCGTIRTDSCSCSAPACPPPSSSSSFIYNNLKSFLSLD